MPSTGRSTGVRTEIAVFLKAVPDSESITVDLRTGRIERAPSNLRLNPFDARALQVARTVRRPGETLTAISMGPPGAEIVLREALAAGADRAILISDPALAGSDAQVTSRVLFESLRDRSVELVLLGARSSDAETGQVPPELAELLGWPLVAGARNLARAPDGPGFEVVADGREGWVRWSVEAPFVLSTGEKIAKPPKPTDDERAAALQHPIERWDLARLGLLASDVGEAGSPTVVAAVDHAAPGREPAIFSEGTPAERVASAWVRLAQPRAPGSGISRSESSPRRTDPPTSAWVVAIDERGHPDDAALPLLAALREELPETPRTLVVPGEPPDPATLRRWSGQGAQRVMVLPSDAPAPAAADVAAALRGASGGSRPDLALLVADPFGREVAGRWAAAEGLGLVGDAMRFDRGPEGPLRFSKPAFGGQYEAWITGRGRPTLATVRPGVFAPASDGPGANVPPVLVGPQIRSGSRSAQRTASGAESDARLGTLEGARRIVTVGMGIGGPEGIDRLVPYLARWGAALGATRRVVDAGWLPVHRQIGLTGRSLAPELAILLGVGKAANHVIGLRRAGRLLAVNPDPEAAVFRYVDAGIVAGWEEVLLALDERLTRPRPDPGAGAY